MAAATSVARRCHLCATLYRPSRSNTAWHLRWPPTPRSFATRYGRHLNHRAHRLRLRPDGFPGECHVFSIDDELDAVADVYSRYRDPSKTS